MTDNAVKRLREFVWYHLHGDGDCNGQVLHAYAQENALSRQDCFDLTYFYATTYCCVSAIFLLQNRGRIRANYVAFAEEYKRKLIFQSDRKYVRMLNNFRDMLSTWVKMLDKRVQDFDGAFVNGNMIDTKKALLGIEKWFFFKRFSAYLFVETYCDILLIEASRAKGMDYEGDSMTFAGGLFYCFGMDNEARFVQERHKLPTDAATFEELLRELQEAVKAAGGDDNITKLETSLCAYEKFFKGTRYNGYYADRMLEETLKMMGNMEFRSAAQAVMRARSKTISHKYLGERNGWNGIRKEQKKAYRENGRIGYCPY